MNYEATTKLEAVNIMLQMIGEQPVNTILVQGFGEASLALTTLHNVSRTIQNDGLHCNVDVNYTLARNSDNEIPVASNILNIDFDDNDLTIRSNKVYNRAEHSFVFDKEVTGKVTWFLPFEELPSHVRNYIAIKAGRKFMLEVVGAIDMFKYTEQQEYDLMVMFKRNELRNKSVNMLDSYDAAKVLRRKV